MQENRDGGKRGILGMLGVSFSNEISRVKKFPKICLTNFFKVNRDHKIFAIHLTVQVHCHAVHWAHSSGGVCLAFSPDAHGCCSHQSNGESGFDKSAHIRIRPIPFFGQKCRQLLGRRFCFRPCASIRCEAQG